ncbi:MULTISPECIES: ABC transporter substrate-binding protein [unclassified Roseitalea]|uniref:ABC transporter substrate-binding protein n=1 Tax=unclassified Roseitalea TaxID=2639107 RepID=UPI00273F0EE2|nr:MULTISPECIES: ABC transporter substrate-binding protein [unclassified Roseitalea]
MLTWLRFIALAGALHAAAAAPALAQADGGVALLAPLSGPFGTYGQSMGASARAVLGDEVTVLDDGCEAPIAARAARTAAASGARLVIGLPCIDAFDAAMPILAEADVPVLATGIQAPDITGTHATTGRWPVFRVAPPADQEIEVLADHLATHWRNVAFAVIDDGTLYGRQLAENVRLALAERALEPVYADTFRPLVETQAALVRRLRRAGATHALIGGDARDAAVIAADAARLDYELTLAGGSFLLAPPEEGALPDGTLIATIPPGTDFTRIAAQIARQTLAADASALAALRARSFETAAGALAFTGAGEPQTMFYKMHVIDDGALVPVSDNEAN